MNKTESRTSFSSNIELLKVQADALFVSDSNDRLRYIREPGYAESDLYPAPRFFMGRSADGNIWRFRHNVPDDIVTTVDHLCRDVPANADFAAPFVEAAAIRTALGEQSPITEEERGPAYWIPESISAPAGSIIISEENAQSLTTCFPWKITSPANFRTSPLAAVLEDGVAVSICYCARITSQIAEAGVETAEGFRGKGYAGVAVATWADAIRRDGIMPLYSTSWENKSSQAVARKLALVCYGENWSIT